MRKAVADCDGCKSPCTHPYGDWFPVSEIKYCRPQVFWIIENLETLNDGLWPIEGVETGYIGMDSMQVSSDAGFVTVAIIYADITSRLSACRSDGDTLKHEIQILGAEYYDQLSQCARDALNYCSGWKKKGNYAQWMANRRQRQKI